MGKKEKKRKKNKNKNKEKLLNITEKLLLFLSNFADGLAIEFLDTVKCAFTCRRSNERQYWQAIKNDRELMRRNFYSLQRRGYVKRGSNNKFLITPKGNLKITKARIKIKNHDKKWDEKWRILIFDIPESRRSKRDDLRTNLKLLGFKKLQQSVWISPYNIDKELEDFIEFYRIRRNVISMICESIDGEEQLRRKFFRK